MPPTADDYVSRAKLAELLDVDQRSISNWRSQHADFPVRVQGREVTFPLGRCIRWYLTFKEREFRARLKSEGSEETREIDRRTRLADLQVKEANAAERLRALTTVASAERLLAEYAEEVRAAHLAAPSKYARAGFPELPFAEALKRLQSIFNAVEVSLQRKAGATESEAA